MYEPPPPDAQPHRKPTPYLLVRDVALEEKSPLGAEQVGYALA